MCSIAANLEVENIEPPQNTQNPSVSAPPRRRKKKIISKKKTDAIKIKISNRKLYLLNQEIHQKKKLFEKELKLKNLAIKKIELEIEKLNS